MKTKLCNTMTGIAVVSAVGWLAATNAHAQYNYTTFSVPGASATWASGISGNYIVGYYADSISSPYHAFLYNIGSHAISTIDEPGASESVATGISGNEVVGYTATGGFLYNLSSQTFATIAPAPGTTEILPRGISGNTISGYTEINGSDAQGFLYNTASHTYTALSAPGAVLTWAMGISGNNVVGYDNDAGFLYNLTSQSFTTLSVPGSGQTWATGISGNNVVGITMLSMLVILAFFTTAATTQPSVYQEE
jgi:hypothetical protein